MNKRINGFTLIELLAVVTIIAIISLIAIPNISKNIRDKKTEISEANQKLLASATDVYIENNKNYDNSYEANGSTYCIPVQTLIDNGVLETPFKDINGQEIDYSKQVKATYQAQYNSFNYELVDTCQEIKQYVSRPNLTDNMIPVTYDETTNTWVKADKNSHWYNYSEKKWANAVLVKELKETNSSKSRDEYKESPAGTPILESDILAQFVWIPRFRYQLFESNEEQPINIIFENISTTKSTGAVTGQWLTHPAFTYNNQELSGIWIAKYEASNQDNNIIIKNQAGTTSLDYVEANKKIIEMTNETNIYGLKDANTHMIRNSEWGALTYLTNSIYGDNQNNSTTGNQTGIYNIEGNKEFVIQDNQDENSLGYALNETKNWTTDNSYTTNDNLYLTRGNNSIYNYQNSKVSDENTTFRISLTNIDSSNQDYQRKYIVTFDPDGGTLSETSKEVSYHEQYGALPTPTKEGYTFMGWNGRNYYNVKNVPSNNTTYITPDVSMDNEDWITINTSNNKEFYNYWTYNLNIVKGTTYDILFEIKEEYNITGRTYMTSTYYEQGQFSERFTDSINGRNIIKSNITARTGEGNFNNSGLRTFYHNKNRNTNEILTFRISVLDEDDTITVDNFEYEPYYITPSTTVVQQKNHTLKAIWKANE